MSNGRAFDSIGVLDMVVYTVLRTLGLYALPLRADNGMTIGQVCEVNAGTFLAHFDGTPILAIKAVREASGFDLRSSKEACEQVRDTYEALAENKRLRDGIERLLAMPDIVPAGTRNYLNGLLDAR